MERRNQQHLQNPVKPLQKPAKPLPNPNKLLRQVQPVTKHHQSKKSDNLRFFFVQKQNSFILVIQNLNKSHIVQMHNTTFLILLQNKLNWRIFQVGGKKVRVSTDESATNITISSRS
jgi:hypothetical protein